MPPACSITLETSTTQSAFNAGILSVSAGFFNALPSANKIPAAGKIATGNMSAFPTFCSVPNARFIFITSFSFLFLSFTANSRFMYRK